MNRNTTILIVQIVTLACLFSFSCFLPAGSCADPTSSIILVIDASGSMNDKNQEGTSIKIDDAKEAAISALDGLDNNTEVALFVFYDCHKIVIENHFTTEFEDIKKKIENITPDGKTPLAKTIAEAVNYMENNSTGREGVIIILTDGGDTCLGDPVEAAGFVKTIMIDTKIHVIDYGTGPREDLEQLAEAGGGSYLRPRDKDELASDIKRTFEQGWDGPDGKGREGNGAITGILLLVFLYLAIIMVLIATFIALVFIFNVIYEYIERSRDKERKKTKRKWWLLSFFKWFRIKFGPWWKKRREKGREARERRRAERERRAEERRRERERKRAEKERWAALKRRERERERTYGDKPGICPFHPLFGGSSRGRERRAHEEEMRRLAEERRRAERERLSDTIRRADEEKRKQAEERRRARDERLVKENRKRKELFRELAELSRNDFGIMPPENLEEQIQQDPYAADVEVARYRGLIEVEKMRRKEQLEKERDEYQKKKEREKSEIKEKKETRRKKGTSCPSCSEEIRYVKSYKRWYCDKCKKYLLRSFEKGEVD